jgi:hypothetical protein
VEMTGCIILQRSVFIDKYKGLEIGTKVLSRL